jgi:hypothetical protein
VSLALAVLAVALAVGWARGGSLDRLGALPLRCRRLVVGALLAQLLGTIIGGPLYPLGLALSAGLVVWFLSRNRGIRGTGLVALGLLGNALVVGANGAMPVSRDASTRAGIGIQDLLTGQDARHEPAGASTRLRWLGDVLPVPLPLRPEVVSPGDVLVAAGLGQLVALGMVGAGTTAAVLQRQGRPRRALPPLPSPARRARTQPPALPPRRAAPPTAGS